MFFEVLAFLGIEAIVYKLNINTGASDANEYGLYFDGNGNYRLKNNKHWVVETKNELGERTIKNVRSGITEINIDELEANKRKQEAINNGKKYYLFRKETDRYSKQKYGDSRVLGDRYAKVEGPGIFVKRTIKYKNLVTEPEFKCWYTGEYYMNAFTCEIYLPTEEQDEKDKVIYGKDYIKFQDHIMELANKKIKETTYDFSSPFSDYPIYLGNEEPSARFLAASKSISNWR